MSAGLKPCPFCKGNDIEFRFHKDMKGEHRQAYGGLYCRTKDCGGAVVFHIYDAEEWSRRRCRNLCMERWNRRFNDEC